MGLVNKQVNLTSDSPQKITNIVLQQTISLDVELNYLLNLITLPVAPIVAETTSSLLSAVAESKEVFSYSNARPESAVPKPKANLTRVAVNSFSSLLSWFRSLRSSAACSQSMAAESFWKPTAWIRWLMVNWSNVSFWLRSAWLKKASACFESAGKFQYSAVSKSSGLNWPISSVSWLFRESAVNWKFFHSNLCL